MKKTYRVTDNCNDFSAIIYTEEEEIQKFGRFLTEIFGDTGITYQECSDNCSLYQAYAEYLERDGFKKTCEKEIIMLKTVDKFLNI